MYNYQSLVHLRFPYHHAYISRNRTSQSVLCFKYGTSSCEWDIFNENDLEGIALYIGQGLSDSKWEFSED